MGATTDGEEMNPGSTEPERILKLTEETCEFEEQAQNDLSLSQEADCYTGIQNQKPADGISPVYDMPQRPISNTLDTDHNETEEQHINAVSDIVQQLPSDTVDDTSETIQGTLEILNTDMPVDLEEGVPPPTVAEIMELLDTTGNDDLDAMYETLQEEMPLGDSYMIKQDLAVNPDVDLMDEEGYTPLYKAALQGHLDRVDKLISQGANPNKPSKGGLTPLHAAAQEGHEDIVDYLILQGADVNVECEMGRTPLHTAAEKGYTNIMDSFLAEGTDVSKKDSTGWTPFNAAVQNGHMEAVKYVMSNGAKQNKYDGMSPLYFALEFLHLDILEFLISKRDDLKEGHLDIVDYLILHGACVNDECEMGKTSLHSAAKKGHTNIMDTFVAKGTDRIDISLLHNTDTDQTDQDGYTPLYKAALQGRLERFDDLISQGANPNKPSKGGLTPLHAAAQKGHEDIVDYFILQGADVNAECERGRTPLHKAAEKGYTNIMDSFLAEGTDVSKKDNTGQTPFLVAVQYGQLKAVNYLIAKGAEQSKFEGMTSLYIAAQSGHLEIVKVLISQGADVNEENDSGQVPLHAAASRGHLDVINFLVDHEADVNKAAMSGWTPFHAAISNGHRDVVEYLTDNLALHTKFDEMTPLYIAARAGHLDIVKFLISQGHDANESNSSGHTPFHGAAMRGHFEVTKYLIRHEADTAMGEGWIPFHATGIKSQPYFAECISTENTEKVKLNAGKTPFDIAVECGRLDLVTGCNSERKRVNEKNSKGEIPLHAAVRSGCIESTIFLILLGADVNKRDDRGTTPLTAAIQNGHVEIVKYLKTKGAQDTRVDGMTQLYVAAQSGRLDMVKFLISKGADVKEENDRGQVALHGAASRGHLEVMKFLVYHGADVNKETKSGWTAFHAAISNGHLDVVRYLSRNGACKTRFLEMSPLYIAARAGHLKVVKFLISKGHDVNEPNGSGHTPFQGAALRCRYEVMEYLIHQGEYIRTGEAGDEECYETAVSSSQPQVVENVYTEGIEKKEKTPLYIAVQRGRFELVKNLIEKGAHVNGTNSNGEIPLHAAARNGNLDITKYLIRQGANLNKKDDVGTTPFLVAVHSGHLEVVKYLKAKGVQDGRVHGITSLYIAAQSGHLDIVKFLISQGAEVNEQNDSGQVPLDGAASGDHLEVVKYLVKHDAHVNKETVTGSTPFFRAVSNGHLEVVKYLRTMGACMTRCLGMTALYVAAQNGHLEVIKFLVEEGANVNDENISGRSPLHAASYTGNLDIVKYLVDSKGNVNEKDRDGWTPLHAATQEEHTDVAIYLITNGADTDATDAEGLTPRLPSSNSCYPHEYPHLTLADNLYTDSQKALGSDRYQDHGDSAKSFETVRCEAVKGNEDQLLGSGGKSQLPTALHVAEHVAQSSPNVLPNEDPVRKQNGYTTVEKTETFSSNETTPLDTEEKIKGDRNPFTHANPKCPANKAPKYPSLATDYSYVYEPLDTKHESIGFQHGLYIWQRNRSTFVHTTERTAYQDVIRSGCGTRIVENWEMKEVPSLIEFRGITGQSLEDKPAAYTSDSRTRTKPFLDKNSTEDCAPVAATVSAYSAQDAKKKSRTTGAQCSPWLALLSSFIQMVVVMAFILTGSPILVAGLPSTEQVVLQAGQSAVIPFDIPRFPDNISQVFPQFMLRFASKQNPFCINGEGDIEGFKSLSQFNRFTTSVAEMASSFCVKVTIDPVDIVDEDLYVLRAFFHGFDNFKQETVRKEILVHIPPGPAKCFITVGENDNYPYEVHCEATTGRVKTALTCYQHGQRVKVEGDATYNDQVTRAVFLLPDHSPFSCCSHDVTSEVNVTMCNDFEWPPSNNHISPSTVNDPNLTPSVANTVAAIGNTDEQASKTLLESQVDSGTIKHYMVSSVYHLLTLGLMIYLFFC